MAELHQNQGFIDNILENLKKVFRFLKELRKFASEIKKDEINLPQVHDDDVP